MPSARTLILAAATGLLSAACSDHVAPVAPIAPDDVVPAGIAPPTTTGAASSKVLLCRANVSALTVSCDESAPTSGAARDLIVGGQNLYVKLTSSGLLYVAGTGSFTFDLTVQNLIPQAMGTNDGTTADGAGVQVFFQTLPTVTGGT